MASGTRAALAGATSPHPPVNGGAPTPAVAAARAAARLAAPTLAAISKAQRPTLQALAQSLGLAAPATDDLKTVRQRIQTDLIMHAPVPSEADVAALTTVPQLRNAIKLLSATPKGTTRAALRAQLESLASEERTARARDEHNGKVEDDDKKSDASGATRADVIQRAREQLKAAEEAAATAKAIIEAAGTSKKRRTPDVGSPSQAARLEMQAMVNDILDRRDDKTSELSQPSRTPTDRGVAPCSLTTPPRARHPERGSHGR